MDHEERVRRFHTEPNTLDPATRQRNEQIRQEMQTKRENGEIAYEFDERYGDDVPDHRPVSDEQQ